MTYTRTHTRRPKYTTLATLATRRGLPVFTKVNFARDHLCGFSHRGDIQLPGLEEIKRHWARAKEEYEARQLTEATVVTTSTDTRSAVL